MYLPGEIHERITDLRKNARLSQKELCDKTGVSPSQLSRIESGITKDISNEILIKLAKEFGVSTDYILGVTKISVPKSYDISELCLSEGAVKGLITGMIDVEMLNRLLEHKSFYNLLSLMRSYFDNSISNGIMERNAVIDMATATLIDYAKQHPEHKAKAKADIEIIKAQRFGEHEAEIEKIKSTFVAILKDIKNDVEDGRSPETTATKNFMLTIQEQVQAAKREQKSFSAEDMADIMTNMVGAALPLDEKGTELLKQLAGHLFAGQSVQNLIQN